MPKKSNTPDARAEALAYLSRREHTRAELRNKLQGKRCSNAAIERALDQLEQESLLSHQRFISDYIQSATRRGYGPNRIRWELKHRKGLAEGEINQGMSQAEVDWVGSARRCCRKKFGVTPVADNDGYAKQRNYLYRRGYPPEVICAALRG